MKKFLISIDAEGDAFWDWTPGQPITTRNSRAVPRFQELCNKYGFKPTYLTNYEMACDDNFVSYIRKEMGLGHCEVGMHLHAWNSPPIYELPNMREDIMPGDCSFLTEYPEVVMEEKISYMTNLLYTQFGSRPRVHRAGRWATNDTYFRLLDQYGYLVDCSVTPGMNMSNSRGFTKEGKGSNYTKERRDPHIISGTSIYEIPMTVRMNHVIKDDGDKRLKHVLYKCYRAIKGRGHIWLRPNGNNIKELMYLTDRVRFEKTDYLMFMLHTSEMCAGCSPTFSDEKAVEKLFADIDKLFSHISRFYTGETIGNYALSLKNKGSL